MVDIFQEIKNDIILILLTMLGQELPLVVTETIGVLWERKVLIICQETYSGQIYSTIVLSAGIKGAAMFAVEK